MKFQTKLIVFHQLMKNIFLFLKKKLLILLLKIIKKLMFLFILDFAIFLNFYSSFVKTLPPEKNLNH